MASVLFRPELLFEMNTDPAMVASVVCATQSVGAHILGLPNLSGDIDEYAGGGGGGGVDSHLLVMICQVIAELGILRVISMNVAGIMLRSNRMCIGGVFRTDMCSGWTSLR